MIEKISVLFAAALLVFTFTITTTYAASSDIDGPSVIHKEANQIFTVMDLLSLYDIDVFIQTDGYTGYGNVPGEYIVTLTQGTRTKDVTIVVIENWTAKVDLKNYILEDSNDVLFVTDYKDIYVSNDRILSLFEILHNIYENTGYILADSKFRYEEIIDEYHFFVNEDGTLDETYYVLSFRLSYYNGEQATYSALIHAVKIPELPGITIDPPPSAIDKIIGIAPWVLIPIAAVYLLTHRKKGNNKYGSN